MNSGHCSRSLALRRVSLHATAMNLKNLVPLVRKFEVRYFYEMSENPDTLYTYDNEFKTERFAYS